MPASDPLPIPAALTVDEEPFADEDLDAFLEHDGEPPADSPVPRWRVDDRGSAQWAMARVAEIDAELEALRVQALDWAERIQQWFDKSAKPLRARRQFFDAQLGRYAIERRLEDEKNNKTLKLPSGDVPTRRDPAKVTIAVKDAVIEWARVHHPGLVSLDIGVSALRSVAKIVERPTRLRLILVCGCVHEVDGVFDPLPQVGDIVQCPNDCGDQLLGNLEVLASVHEVVDDRGELVPGATIEPEQLTYTVKPIR